MKGFKQCTNGHFFKEDLNTCPYCPRGGDSNKTQVSGGGPTVGVGDSTISTAGNDSTQLSGDGMKTQIFGTSSNTTVLTGNSNDLNRTFIQVPEEVVSGDQSKQVVTQRSTKKIVGWIISYTLDPMGSDYRLYEGNNTIGRAPENTITLVKDQGISSKHVTILFKKDKFYIKDEMAQNGTFLNDEEMEIGKPYELKDGDNIRLGQTTVFKFKSAQ